jgi:hypothetical protein
MIQSLVISTAKAIAVSFHTWQKKILLKPQIKFDSTDVTYKPKTKFWGIHINKNMKWDGHIKYLSSKLSKSYYVVKSLKDVTSPEVVRNIHIAYFQPDLAYSFILGIGDPISKSIFKLQQRVMQLIINVGRYTLCREIFKALKVLPVPCMYTSEMVRCIKISIHNLEQNTEILHHNRCQSLDLHVHFWRTSVFKIV